jgi:hypothetical protein
MRAIIKWIVDNAAQQIENHKERKRIKIEGKRSKDAVGRTKRLHEARAAKERYLRTGNKSTDVDI